jgi:hypothetical protein
VREPDQSPITTGRATLDVFELGDQEAVDHFGGDQSQPSEIGYVPENLSGCFEVILGLRLNRQDAHERIVAYGNGGTPAAGIAGLEQPLV